MSQFNRKFGWLKDKEDPRDLKFTATKPEKDLPLVVDFREKCSEVYDQGQLGSCTANAIAGAMEHLDIKNAYKWPHIPSRLFIYYNERKMEGTIDQDSGAYIRDGIKSVNLQGACPELIRDGSKPEWLWPYSDDAETFKKEPPKICYEKAVYHKALKYESVKLDRASVLNALAEGKPVIFGFMVHQSFQSDAVAKTGIMPIPRIQLIDPILGGHAVCAVGYLLDHPMGTQKVKDWLIVRNSWGNGWGDNGYFYMPLDRVFCNRSECSDAWAISATGYAPNT